MERQGSSRLVLVQMAVCGLCLVLLTAPLSSASLQQLAPASSRSVPMTCSKNMPCKWAVCTWSRARPLLVPDDSCIEIDNQSCSCPYEQPCVLSPNFMEPLSTQGAAFIKFEYRCWSFFPLTKRSSSSSS